ncbi:hypothetical protein LTR28_002796, partial [Elasticomyces elasticus]
MPSAYSSLSQYPSTASHRPRQTDKPRTDPPPLRPTPRSAETSIRIPRIEIGRPSMDQSEDATGEPLVEDFQDHYMVKPFDPAEHLTRASDEMERRPSMPTSPGFSVSDTDADSSASPGASRSNSASASDNAPAPPDFTRKDVHVPTRSKPDPQRADKAPSTRSRAPSTGNEEPRLARRLRQASSSTAVSSSTPTTPESRHHRSSDDRSSVSQDTSATSVHTLPPLQSKGPYDDNDRLTPLLEDDPSSFDLIAAPEDRTTPAYSFENRADLLYSNQHLKAIFADPRLLVKFTTFLNAHRPQSIPILIYYLDALKALRAVAYANAIAEALEPIHAHPFTQHPARTTQNSVLEDRANQAFEVLVRDDLPAYVAHMWIQVVSISIQRRITGTLAPHLREASEGLAEVFCLSDPSRDDNPIVFASEEFHRTTQYGMTYSIGRNCRFLQGPRTNPHSVRRLAEACKAGREHCEVFVNYRRDGSPFMNLLMIAPLLDSRGNIRYYIGAQVDVSGLVKECTDLDGFARCVERAEEALEQQGDADRGDGRETENKDEFQALSEMFNASELETVRKYGGSMHREQVDEGDRDGGVQHRPRLLLKDPSSEMLSTIDNGQTSRRQSTTMTNGRLEGIYQNYLLVRPYPSLRILFTSPSLRVPGIAQSHFLSRIGGSARVRDDLTAALAQGRGVTAKIRWLTKADSSTDGVGRSRWIHCTPLLGHAGAVGVWMVILVDDE